MLHRLVILLYYGKKKVMSDDKSMSMEFGVLVFPVKCEICSQ